MRYPKFITVLFKATRADIIKQIKKHFKKANNSAQEFVLVPREKWEMKLKLKLKIGSQTEESSKWIYY